MNIKQKILFNPINVHKMHIYFYNENYDKILKDRKDKEDKKYEIADIDFTIKNKDQVEEVIKFKNVGVRYKGNSTYNRAIENKSPKIPFNIDFNLNGDLDCHDKPLYPNRLKDQSLLGYNKIKLANSLFDQTFVKEHLGYLFTRDYTPCPLTSNIEVYVNLKKNYEKSSSDCDDTLLGVYIMIEAVNKQFLEKNFGNDKGTFFKCDIQGKDSIPTTASGSVNNINNNDDFAYQADLYKYGDLELKNGKPVNEHYLKAYERKSDDNDEESDWKNLFQLINTINQEKPNFKEIEKILNVDRVLWFFATNMIILQIVENSALPLPVVRPASPSALTPVHGRSVHGEQSFSFCLLLSVLTPESWDP